MKKTIFLLIFAVFFTVNAIAQDKSSDLKKLLELMQKERMVNVQISAMLNPVFSQLESKLKDDASVNKFKEFKEYVMDEMNKTVGSFIDNDLSDIYDKHFTHEEVKNLIGFYESPTGRKMLEKTPEIMTETVTIMTTKYMPEFQNKLKEKLEEMK